MGAFGTVVRTAIEGGLADLHQGQRATALTEANVIASIGASSVPLFIGGWQALELGWRPALLVPLIVLSLLILAFSSHRGSRLERDVGDPDLQPIYQSHNLRFERLILTNVLNARYTFLAHSVVIVLVSVTVAC